MRNHPDALPDPAGIVLERDGVAVLLHRWTKLIPGSESPTPHVGVSATFALGAGPRFRRADAPWSTETERRMAEWHPDATLSSDGVNLRLAWIGRGTSEEQLMLAIDAVAELARHDLDRFCALADLENAHLLPAHGPWEQRALPRVETTRAAVELVVDPVPRPERGAVEVTMFASTRPNQPAREIAIEPDLGVPAELASVLSASSIAAIGSARLRLDDGGATLLWPRIPSVEAARAGAELLAAVAAPTSAYR